MTTFAMVQLKSLQEAEDLLLDMRLSRRSLGMSGVEHSNIIDIHCSHLFRSLGTSTAIEAAIIPNYTPPS